MTPTLFDSLFRTRTKWWLLLLAGILFIAYQADNTPRTDDEYLGEQVYWLLHQGKVRSELGYSELGYDVYQSIYHKLFIYAGYVACRIAGWSLASLHLVAYSCFLAFIPVGYRYTKNRYGPEAKSHFFALLILMLFNQDLLYAAGDFRPEIMIMPLGLAAYMLLERFLEERRYALLAASAACAGLCMFCHLNGLIFIAAGCGLLLWRKMFRDALLYALVAVVAFSPYFIDVLVHADFSWFLQQFAHDPVLSGEVSHWYTPLLKILNEQSRFLFTGQHIVFTAALLVAWLAAFKKLRATQRNLLRYTALLILTLALVNPSKSTKYLVLYLPFLYIILIEGWRYIEQGSNRRLKTGLRSLLLAGVALSLFYSSRHVYSNVENLRTGGIVAEGRQLADKIPGPHAQIRLLAPRIMVFNEIGRFRRLEDIGLIARENLLSFLQHSGTAYVIFSKDDTAYFRLPELLQQGNSGLQAIAGTAHYILVAVRNP